MNIASLRIGEIRRIYLDHLGFVPEPVMRDFVRLATGREQSARGLVSVVTPWDVTFVYGRDRRKRQLLFMPMIHAMADVAVVVLANTLGTWGRFAKRLPDRAAVIQRELALSSPYTCFEAYDDRHGAGLPRLQVRREYMRLDWRRDRPPRGGDRISLADFLQLAREKRITLHDPVREMPGTMPAWIRDRFARSRGKKAGAGNTSIYSARDEAAIVEALGQLGYVAIRDQALIDCYLGRCVDVDSLVANLRVSHGIMDLLADLEVAAARRPQVPR